VLFTFKTFPQSRIFFKTTWFCTLINLPLKFQIHSFLSLTMIRVFLKKSRNQFKHTQSWFLKLWGFMAFFHIMLHQIQFISNSNLLSTTLFLSLRYKSNDF
jgi:hypothetical protein